MTLGEEAVLRMFDILHEETHTALGLCGRHTWVQLSPRSVKGVPPVVAPEVSSVRPPSSRGDSVTLTKNDRNDSKVTV